MKYSLRSRLIIVGLMLLPVLATLYCQWQHPRPNPATTALVPLVLGGIVLIERIVLLYRERRRPPP